MDGQETGSQPDTVGAAVTSQTAEERTTYMERHLSFSLVPIPTALLKAMLQNATMMGVYSKLKMSEGDTGARHQHPQSGAVRNGLLASLSDSDCFRSISSAPAPSANRIPSSASACRIARRSRERGMVWNEDAARLVFANARNGTSAPAPEPSTFS